MTVVVQLGPFAIDKAKEAHSMKGQITVPVDQLDRQGERALKLALKDIGRGEEQKFVFNAWANLQVASSRLCSLITRQYPGTGDRPLVNEILSAAFDAFMASSRTRDPDLYSMLRYLNVLADAAYGIQRVNVYVLDANGIPHAWPYFAQPLGVWARKAGAKEVFFSPAPEPTIDAIVGGRNVLCARIMSIHDIGKLALMPEMAKPRKT